MRVLALAMGVPFPPDGGGLMRTFQLLRAIAPHHDVVLAAFTYGEDHEPPAYPVRVEAVPWRWSRAYLDMIGDDAALASRAWEYLTWGTEQPWFASVSDPAPMEETLSRLSEESFDLVLLEGMPLTVFLHALPRDVPRVLDLFDVHSLIARRSMEGTAGTERDMLEREAARTLAWERRAVQACDVCLTVSREEAIAAGDLLHVSGAQVVPNGVDTAHFSPGAEGPGSGVLLFTGRMSYGPNADAACFFAEEVLPLVRRRVPHATFHVVGSGPPPEVARLASESVVVHGRVPDVRPHLRDAEVVVVPVRQGGGTRLKVLEAAAAGKAIVSTTRGVEGLAFRPGRDLLVANSADGIADAAAGLLTNPARRAELGTNARVAVVPYDWSAIGRSFRSILEQYA